MRDMKSVVTFIELTDENFHVFQGDRIVGCDGLRMSERPLRNVEGIRRNCRHFHGHAIDILGIVLSLKMNFTDPFSAFRRYKTFWGIGSSVQREQAPLSKKDWNKCSFPKRHSTQEMVPCRKR